jgi:hypothetical protein
MENTFGCKIALGCGGPDNTSGYWLKFIIHLSKLALKEYLFNKENSRRNNICNF